MDASIIVAEWRRRSSQEMMVLLMVAIVFLIFSIFIKGFLHIENLLLLVRSVSVLGIFGAGMAIVIIGRGIDLSQISCMAVSTAWLMVLMKQGVSMPIAIAAGLGLAVICGLANGLIIAFLEIPAIFATLATSILILGAGRWLLLFGIIHHVLPTEQEKFLFLGQGRLFGIPVPILVFAAVALLVHMFLTRTRYGYFISAHGDNDQTAAITGIPVRPLTILQYVLCVVIGYIAGLVYSSSIGSMNLDVATGTYVIEVILVVVLGGVSLAGGRGGTGSVIIGTILIGTLSNGFTILDVNSYYQQIIKGIVLLGAILLDTRLHPRSEEIIRYGEDI